MKLFTLTIVAALCVALASPVLACACEIDCKPGESYSDAEEMCVPDATA